MNLLPGWFPGGVLRARAANLTFLQSETPKSTTASSYTFTSANIGTATPDRVVVVGVSGLSSIDDRTLSSVTIGGNAASLDANAASHIGGGSSVVACVASLLVTSGTSADIVVAFSNTMLGCCCHVYTLTDYQSATPSDTEAAVSNASAASVSGTINVTGPGALLMCGSTSASVTGLTLGGTTEDAETNSTAPGSRLASGMSEGLGTESSRSLTVTPTSNNNLALAAAVWR